MPPTGQTDFTSAPPAGAAGGRSASVGFGSSSSSGSSAPAAAPAQGGTASSSTAPRTVQETDLYRLDGNRLYYLNAYRGLMVFDVTNVDQPKLLGRSAIYGSPVQMFVTNGIAVIVVADWYGTMDNGQPFHGSIVRGLDATDPSNIKVLGEAKLGGWVQDTRIVGNVLYAVSEDYGWVYGWSGGYGGGVATGSSTTATGPTVLVSSVSFAGGLIQQIASKSYPGYGGVFNVTPTSIMFAHPVAATQPSLPAPAKTALQYLDISDPNGAIVERGTIQVAGSIQGWGADNGRWNLDFADGKVAHVIGCGSTGCGSGYVLATADFTNPDHPTIASELPIASSGWSASARFDSGRMYLSPGAGYYYSPNSTGTPLQIFDLSNPAAPKLAGQTEIPGSVWLMIPSGKQLFALGQDYNSTPYYSSSRVSLKYLDVTSATGPSLLGTSSFGDGWAWTPAAQTFKAFTKEPDPWGTGTGPGLVVLPFSGWSAQSRAYNNGVQLIEYTPTSITTAGAAHTKGWVERGIFANGRILSLSDLSLSVVDYTDPLAPTVTAELTLARNVIAAQPTGAMIAQISTDWWGNDNSKSEVRVLPITDAAENLDESAAPSLTLPGTNARVFTNGQLTYIVTAVETPYPCPVYNGQPPYAGQPTQCTGWQQQVQVVDLSGGTAKPRGTLALPIDPNGWYGGWGWGGFYYYDWYEGGEIVQVGADALAFRRYHPNYSATGQYVSASRDLYVVDLSNPDKPDFASAVITNDPNGWWGNMKVINSTLYTTHYVWPAGNVQNPTVRYYLDAIDLSDRKNPKVQASINVPGILVGGSPDGSILYTIDYHWGTNGSYAINDFDTLKLYQGRAYLQSTTQLDGWVGNVFVRGTTAYTSTQQYVYTNNQPGIELHQIDLGNPAQPVDRVASGPGGWGWLVDVQGDRLLVTSGWGYSSSPPGLDIYRLSPNAAPAYDQFVRTRGWSISSVARQDNQLFLSSGDWGVQAVQLK
ncbi:MAG: beta-propeller domain-containing protein [Myxococcota bacterium]|nr:beta-propeller domain-containing protein [Myxococcota bacterium]